MTSPSSGQPTPGAAVPQTRPDVTVGPLGGTPQRLTQSREGRRLLLNIELRAGEVKGRELLARLGAISETDVALEAISEELRFARGAREILSADELSRSNPEVLASLANTVFGELQVAHITIARTAFREITNAVASPLVSSRGSSILDGVFR